ncbi:hypothetical protein SK128_005980 [Halocaridina rubra]|uniref:Uncharacterized protein n=1 Tax=Halocaridina rubra TaxID=373956 RepID=A0AAN9AGP2_HALRR
MALKLCVLLILILGTKSGYETSSDNFSEENGREHVISPDTTKDIMLQSTFGKSWADPEEDLGSDLRILNGGVEPTKADISKIDLTKSAKSGIQTVSLVSMDREQLSVKAESSVPMEKEQVPSITEQLFVKTVTLTKEADDATLKKEEANNSGKTEKATLDNNLETDVKNIAALKGDSEVTTLNDFSKTQMTYSGDVLIVGTNINQSVKNQDTMAPEVAMHARKTWSILGHMVWQVLERYVRTCHFIAMTSYLNEGILPEVLSGLRVYTPAVFIFLQEFSTCSLPPFHFLPHTTINNVEK